MISIWSELARGNIDTKYMRRVNNIDDKTEFFESIRPVREPDQNSLTRPSYKSCFVVC